MKKLLLLLFISAFSYGQSNTEIYLYDLENNNGEFTVGKGKNISNNPGYDSQPHFYSRKSIVFASTRNKQTDIAAMISARICHYLINPSNAISNGVELLELSGALQSPTSFDKQQCKIRKCTGHVSKGSIW